MGSTRRGPCNNSARGSADPRDEPPRAILAGVRDAVGRLVVVGMAVLAAFVQIAVWGATKLRGDGALLESWQPYFGWAFGVVFGAAQLLACRALRLDRAARWLVPAWLSTVPLDLLGWAAGRPPSLDAAVALAAGLGALVLAAALLDNRLAPPRPRP